MDGFDCKGKRRKDRLNNNRLFMVNNGLPICPLLYKSNRAHEKNIFVSNK